jgi:phosphomannomutase
MTGIVKTTSTTSKPLTPNTEIFSPAFYGAGGGKFAFGREIRKMLAAERRKLDASPIARSPSNSVTPPPAPPKSGGGDNGSGNGDGTKMTKAGKLSAHILETLQRYPEFSGLQSEIDLQNFWEAALVMGKYFNKQGTSDAGKEVLMKLIGDIRDHQGELARTSDASATVVFGTSGWRGRIGEEFTILNVHKTVRGIIEMMQTEEFLRVNGYRSFDEVKEAGVLVLRDNRYMGDDFIEAAIKELVAEGIRVYNAGECPTGVGSAVQTTLGAAASINFTPSHNPMDYAGLKFNPRDGGPAAKELTTLIEEKANAYMVEGAKFEPAAPTSKATEELTSSVDAKTMFAQYMDDSAVFDTNGIRSWVQRNRDDLLIVVDNMHGSSRGYLEAVLGNDVMVALEESGSITFLNTNDDVSFHGIKPEPSPANQKPIVDKLAASGRKYTLGVFLDPDADRIRFADAKMDIPMNLFGAIAFADSMEWGSEGGVATTVSSSDFALEIAKQNGRTIFETAVGFKYFRPYLRDNQASVAFEESDGISFGGHTLEKDAVGGFFAALSAMASNGKNLSEQYSGLQKKYGYFYPLRDGVEVKGVTTEQWQAYKKAVLDVLVGGLIKPGDAIKIGGKDKEVKEVVTKDGLKVVFTDRSWLLMRPSGTEPKFRIYVEVVGEEPIDNVSSVQAAYKNAGEEILARARAQVDG